MKNTESLPVWNSLADEYDRQIEEGIISPKLIEFVPEPRKGKRDELIVATEEQKFTGALCYTLMQPKDKSRLESELRKIFEFSDPRAVGRMSDAEGFRDYSFRNPLAYLRSIESFNKGSGTRMLDTLKTHISIEGIFLDSVQQAKGWFERQGFKYTGLEHVEAERPAMIWMKSGRY